MKKHWMKDAVKPGRKGVFRKKAERAGESTAQFASEHAGDKGKLGKEARLAKTFAKHRPGKRKSKRKSGRSRGR